MNNYDIVPGTVSAWDSSQNPNSFVKTVNPANLWSAVSTTRCDWTQTGHSVLVPMVDHVLAPFIQRGMTFDAQ